LARSLHIHASRLSDTISPDGVQYSVNLTEDGR